MSGASRTTVTRATSSVRGIDTLPQTAVGFCGVTERGPFVATLVTSYAEYVQVFGGPSLVSRDMDLALKSFFDEGGKIAYIARTTHYTTITDATSNTSVVGTVTLQDRANTPLDTLTIAGKTTGAYAANITIQVAASSSGVASEFNLYVLVSGVITERFVNLSMTTTAVNYVVTVVNSGAGTQLPSNLIAVADLASATASPGNMPAVAVSSAMASGSNGLTSLADTDFVGASGTNGPTGLRLFDEVEQLDVLCVPGRATSTVHNGAITYADVTRAGKTFCVLDCPSGVKVAAMRTYVTSTASLKGLTEGAAIYYPRILVDNPNAAIFGTGATVTAPPSGAIAGLMARIDASKDGGSFEQPASIEFGFLRSARGLESTTDVRDEAKRGLAFDDLINPIMAKAGRPIHVDGARTLKSTGSFPSVGESRGVMSVAVALSAAVDPKRNQNNRPKLRNEILMDAGNYLSRLTAKGCFASNVDAEAWYFDIGDALNSAAEQAAGNVNARLGLALAKPGEFINIVIAPL